MCASRHAARAIAAKLESAAGRVREYRRGAEAGGARAAYRSTGARVSPPIRATASRSLSRRRARRAVFSPRRSFSACRRLTPRSRFRHKRLSSPSDMDLSKSPRSSAMTSRYHIFSARGRRIEKSGPVLSVNFCSRPLPAFQSRPPNERDAPENGLGLNAQVAQKPSFVVRPSGSSGIQKASRSRQSKRIVILSIM